MKKYINKIKISLTTLRTTIISLSSKTMGNENIFPNVDEAQPLYGIKEPMELIEEKTSIIPTFVDLTIKIISGLLIAIIFIVGIISFIRIRKIDNKALKKKKIRNTFIIIAILILILIASFLVSFRLHHF